MEREGKKDGRRKTMNGGRLREREEVKQRRGKEMHMWTTFQRLHVHRKRTVSITDKETYGTKHKCRQK